MAILGRPPAQVVIARSEHDRADRECDRARVSSLLGVVVVETIQLSRPRPLDRCRVDPRHRGAGLRHDLCAGYLLLVTVADILATSAIRVCGTGEDAGK
jgi:hypothetical protein